MEEPRSLVDCFYFDETRPRAQGLARRLLLVFVLNDPAYSATVLMRFQQRLAGAGWRRLSRLAARLNYALNAGVEISPSARIGKGLFFHHCQGTVIGGDSRVGRNVHIFKNVLLGEKDGRYPEIGDNCALYANTVIIGGVKIGSNSVIAPNSVVVDDIPEGKIAAGIPARVLKDNDFILVNNDGVPVKRAL